MLTAGLSIGNPEGTVIDEAKPCRAGLGAILRRPILSPAQIMFSERERADAFACRRVNRIEDRRCNKRHTFLSDTGDPAVCFDIMDIDVLWKIRHADWRIVVKIRLLDGPVSEANLLTEYGA